jgi:hypothetical protein
MRELMTHAIQVAGGIQLAIILANAPLPRKLQVRRHLAPLPRFVRQVFYVHWIYIVLTLGLFSALCLAFSAQMAGASFLGRFLSGYMALFWLLRLALQLTYYDREIRRANRWLDAAYVVALVLLVGIFGGAALWPVV